MIDCHQHLWPAPFLDALRSHGMLRDWTLHLPGAPPPNAPRAATRCSSHCPARSASNTGPAAAN